MPNAIVIIGCNHAGVYVPLKFPATDFQQLVAIDLFMCNQQTAIFLVGAANAISRMERIIISPARSSERDEASAEPGLVSRETMRETVHPRRGIPITRLSTECVFHYGV